MSNPFSIETNNKKFFTGLTGGSLDTIYENQGAANNANRIRNMNNELEELARKKQEMMFKESQMDYIFKRQKPSVGLGDFITGVPNKNDKKFRVRALLKEKKQSLHDFLDKKKEIYLSKMNINIKKEETSKLADYIRDEQETLKARQLYFQNDVQFMHRFIDGIKKQADDAQAAVQAQLKQQQFLVSRLNSLQVEIQKIDNLISKDLEALDSLQTYKKFIEDLYDGERNWKKYVPKVSEEVLFMTQGGAPAPKLDSQDGMGFVINYQPENMIQIFNDAEEANIREIQNLQDKEDELESVSSQEKDERSKLEQVIKEYEDRIQKLEKTCQKKAEDCHRLKEMKKANNNRMDVLDNENLDVDKMGAKIFHIYKQVDPKRAQEVQLIGGESEMKKQMTEIEGDISKLRSQIQYLKDTHQSLIPQIDKDIKNKQKRENLERKQEQNKRLELKKQQQQQKKRNQAQNEKPRGRRDMEKVMLKKKAKKEKVVDTHKQDDDEKYLDDN